MRQLVVVEDLAFAGVLDLVGDLAHRRVQAVDRDQADRRVLGAVALGRHVALAGVDRELHADLGALVERAEHEVGVEHLDVADGLDVAGGHGAGALLLHHHALGAFALHLDGDVLDVEHDVGDVLAHAGDRRELVQHAVDLHRLHRRALQRRQQHAAQRIAERHAEAALERLGDDASPCASASVPSDTCSLFGLISSCQFFWITSSPIVLSGAVCPRDPTPPRGE